MASSYQTLTNVYSDVRKLAGKDSNTLSDADLLVTANKYYGLLIRELVGLNEELYAEISSTDLVANQREYVLPIDNTSSTYGGGLIKLQRVEITYDATNWHVARPISLQEFSGPTILDADLNAMTVKTDPRYWFKDRSLWIGPVPDSTDSVSASNAGLRIFWIKRPDELSSGTSIPEIPKDFLSALSEGILYDVYRRFGRTGGQEMHYRISIILFRE